ncbi:MAG: CDP-alcohol phosphatidyltransferase family protein, partial [Actinobacteria bacterium]|nr:CDP-alcohol phosphatidyltransferase family protein [Actinomycetota bacterium]
HQISRVGQLLDPVADRLYILATLIGLLLRGIVPLWFVLLLVSRDLIMSVVLAVLKRRGVTGLPVHFVGKAATFCLLYAFPLLLLGDGAGWLADTAKVVGWAFAVWGTALYWWAAVLYIGQARRIMAATP